MVSEGYGEKLYFIDYLDDAMEVDLPANEAAHAIENVLSTPAPDGSTLELVEHGTLRVIARWRGVGGGTWRLIGRPLRGSNAWKRIREDLRLLTAVKHVSPQV